MFQLQTSIVINYYSVLWYYGPPPPGDTYKATISNVLTIYLMATMYSITHDPTLLHGGVHGGAIDIYDWLVSKDLVDPSTGDQKDGMGIDSCHPGGAVSITDLIIVFINFQYFVLLTI